MRLFKALKVRDFPENCTRPKRGLEFSKVQFGFPQATQDTHHPRAVWRSTSLPDIGTEGIDPPSTLSAWVTLCTAFFGMLCCLLSKPCC